MLAFPKPLFDKGVGCLLKPALTGYWHQYPGQWYWRHFYHLISPPSAMDYTSSIFLSRHLDFATMPWFPSHLQAHSRTQAPLPTLHIRAGIPPTDFPNSIISYHSCTKCFSGLLLFRVGQRDRNNCFIWFTWWPFSSFLSLSPVLHPHSHPNHSLFYYLVLAMLPSFKYINKCYFYHLKCYSLIS